MGTVKLLPLSLKHRIFLSLLLLLYEQEMKEQQNNDRSQRHSSTLAEQRQQQVARDEQMRNAQIQRINQYHQKEAFNQEKKDLRIAVHSQKLQEYRSQVLP